jgi:PAS domain S-box-containing protein
VLKEGSLVGNVPGGGGSFEPAMAAATAETWLSISDDCIKVLDLDGRLLSLNDGGRTLLEVEDPGDLVGRPWQSFWKAPARELATEAVAAAGRGERRHFRGAADTLKGTPKYWDVEVAPIAGPDGQPIRILVISRDVSQEQRNEQRLLEIARRVSENARIEAENLRRLLRDAPSIMCVLRGPRHVFELLNQAALQLTGHRDLLGMAARDAFPGADGDALIKLLDSVYATGEPFVVTDAAVPLQRQPGEAFEDAFLNLVFQPIRDEEGKVSGIFVEGTDITARVRVERALAESEKRLRLAQEVAGIGSLEVDIATGETRGSEQFWRIWGLSPRGSINIKVLEDIVLPEDREVRSHLETRRDGSAAPEVEYRIRRPDTGEIRWVARHIEFTHDAAGRPQQMIGVMQDITARKQAEEQRALLTRELEHRMKNTLAMVGAIATQTLKGDDMEAARSTLIARLAALAAANDILLLRDWNSAPVQGVVEGALKPHMASEGRVSIGGPPLWVNAKQGLSLSLGLHELATNAAKYGALSNSRGTVSIAWSTGQGADGTPIFRLEWRERGGPPVTPPSRRGFGSRLIEQVVAADFHGSVGIEYEPAGVSCVLEAPLSDLPAAGKDSQA